MNDDIESRLAAAPFAASSFATEVDRLFYTMVAVCGIAALAVTLLIIIFCVRYRRGRRIDRHIRYRARWAEYLWIGIPFLIFLAFFFWGAHLYLRYQQLPENPLVIRVIAKQWMWKFYHPGGQREINELHIPAGRPIMLRLASEDVIHSFFVPGFRVKQDVVPGRYNRVAFTAGEPGTFHLFCAEYCGTQHSRMRGVVTVMEAGSYARWLERQAHAPSLARAGERLFRSHGCSGCHADAEVGEAPSLIGVAGRTVKLGDGRTVTADSAYLRDSILLPEKDVVAGFAPIMPSFADQLSEEEVFKLVSYLQSLGRKDRNTLDGREPPP